MCALEYSIIVPCAVDAVAARSEVLFDRFVCLELFDCYRIVVEVQVMGFRCGRFDCCVVFRWEFEVSVEEASEVFVYDVELISHYCLTYAKLWNHYIEKKLVKK